MILKHFGGHILCIICMCVRIGAGVGGAVGANAPTLFMSYP